MLPFPLSSSRVLRAGACAAHVSAPVKRTRADGLLYVAPGRHRELICQLLKEATGLSDIVWRPSSEMLREEGFAAAGSDTVTANSDQVSAELGCHTQIPRHFARSGAVTFQQLLSIVKMWSGTRYAAAS